MIHDKYVINDIELKLRTSKLRIWSLNIIFSTLLKINDPKDNNLNRRLVCSLDFALSAGALSSNSSLLFNVLNVFINNSDCEYLIVHYSKYFRPRANMTDYWDFNFFWTVYFQNWENIYIFYLFILSFNVSFIRKFEVQKRGQISMPRFLQTKIQINLHLWLGRAMRHVCYIRFFASLSSCANAWFWKSFSHRLSLEEQISVSTLVWWRRSKAQEVAAARAIQAEKRTSWTRTRSQL